MTLAIFVRDEALEEDVLQIVDILPDRIAANVCRSADAFISTVKRSVSGAGVFVIFCKDISDIRRLYRHRNLFADRQVVVVLPESDRGTAAPGFDLNARVVLYPEQARTHLAEILQRMIDRRQTGRASAVN